MFSVRISLALSLICCALAGVVMTLLRMLAAPLWLIISAIIVLSIVLILAATYLYAGNGRYQEHQPTLAPFKEYSLIAAALCFFLVALFRLPQLLADAMVLSLLLVLAPMLASIACVVRFACGEEHFLSGPLALVPIFYLCIHLMNFYRVNSNHPDTSTFGYEIVVLSLLLLGLYMTSSSKYKARHPVAQRIWSMFPLSAIFMELFMLFSAPKLLYQAEDLNAATLLTMIGAGTLLITPLFSPIQPVSQPKDPIIPTDDDPEAETDTPELETDIPELEEDIPSNEGPEQ